MKLLIVLLFTSLYHFGQTTPEELANGVFSACIASDKKGFQEYLADNQEISIFLKNIDASITDEQILSFYPEYKDKAITGFSLFQDDAAMLELDLNNVKITKTQVEDRSIGFITVPNTKSIMIFFTCSGKNFCFMIPEIININGKWFLGVEAVQLYSA